jgi:hypothetical protein
MNVILIMHIPKKDNIPNFTNPNFISHYPWAFFETTCHKPSGMVATTRAIAGFPGISTNNTVNLGGALVTEMGCRRSPEKPWASF